MPSKDFLRDAVVPLGRAKAAAVAWRSKGQLQVTVLAKATFAFANDAPMALIDPQEILRAEVHHGNHPARSVRFASDLAPHVPRAEVLFTGHAHAPAGASVRSLPLRLGVFDGTRAVLDKALLARDSVAFERMPVVYERAFGGFGAGDNPLGVGARPGSGEPTIVDPAAPARMAGFGPIGREWPSRKQVLGTTALRTLEAEIAEIPDGFDWSYFQTAPADQRVDSLRGDEWIVMVGLHPTLPQVRMCLPRARGLARIHGLSAFGIAEGEPLALRADTLRIDGDEEQCTLVWRASFPVAGEGALAALRVLSGVELPGQPIPWPPPGEAFLRVAAPPESPAPPSSAAPSFAGTVVVVEEAAAAKLKMTLPFVAGAGAEGATRAPPSERALTPRRPAFTGTVTVDPEPVVRRASFSGTVAVSPGGEAAPAHPLPFLRPVAPLPPPPPPPPPPQRGDLPEQSIRPTSSASPGPSAPEVMPSPEPAALPGPAPEPALPPQPRELALDLCAEVAAELGLARSGQDAIFETHAVSGADWTGSERHWQGQIKREARYRRRTLLDAYDLAYVEELAKLRGPIGVREYARLVVAAESGDPQAALDELSIPRSGLMRVRRLWIKKTLGDEALLAAVAAEIAALRAAGLRTP